MKNRIQVSLCEILLLSRFLVNLAVDTCCTFTCPIFLEPAEETKNPEPEEADEGGSEKKNDEAITYRAQKRATGSLLLEAGWWPGGNMIILLGRMCFFFFALISQYGPNMGPYDSIWA